MSNRKPAKPSIEPCYLLLGPENGKRNEFIASIRAEITTLTGEPPEEHKVYAFEADFPGIVGILNNLSLFSTHRLVMIHEAQQIKKKGDVELLVKYLASPNDASTIIFVTDDYRVDRAIESAVGKKRTTTFWELFENQKRSWIQTFIRSAGSSITAEAIELILDLVENDTAELRRECEKLVLYYPRGTKITEDEVERLVYHSKNESVFTLFEHFASGDFSATIETLHAIILSGPLEPASLLGGLSWQIRRLLEFRRLKDAHYSDEDAAKRAKIVGKRNLAIYQRGAKTYSVPDLERIVVRTGEYDVRFREVRTDIDRRLIELFVYETVVRRGAHPLFGGEVA
jgi:DNA polymerase III subunit delta